uniref:low affinity immunoglobulin gamma Fc region receptor III-like isoform X4 n=1 Tax=Phascolarctos cinereus TaxID=38626 RepID=UPI000A28AB06|nr:low affinity immunoglobulin gamma Fc region receptor III-like isoform X4 [Phascolarctos cinereus]
MLLWALLLILGLVSTQASIAKKAVVHLSPPWTTIFKGEKVTLTCHGFNSSKPRTTRWYQNQQLQENWSTISIEANQTGEYRCQTQNSALSDPVNLVVSSDLLILQVPYSVFEGDTLVLRCQGSDGAWRATDVTYYKDEKISSYFLKYSNFSIPRVGLSYSGKYHCTGVFRNAFLSQKRSSRKVELQVQGTLISGILMETQPSGGQVTEGEKLVLICSVAQGTGNITFSWYREGIKARLGEKTRHSLKEKFVLSAVSETDAGKYYCTANNGINTISSQTASVTVRSRDLSSQFNSSENVGHLALGLIVPQFILVGLSVSALLFCFGPWSKSGTPVGHCEFSSGPPQQSK